MLSRLDDWMLNMMIKRKSSFSHHPALMPVCVALALYANYSLAFEPLDEAELSGVHAQDGLTVSMTSNMTIDQLNLHVDPGTASEGVLSAQNISLNAVSTSGVVGGAANAVTTLDVGASGVGTDPYVAFTLNTDLARLRVGALKHSSDSARSYGTMALDGDISLSLAARDGLFNLAANDTKLRGEITDGAIFYRGLWHQHPYLVLNNLHALWDMEGGRLGISNQGIEMSADVTTLSPYINIALDYDLLYKFPFHYGEGTDFMITGNEAPILHFGWIGSLRDVQLVWRPGGAWAPYNTASKTQGLNFSSRWNFVNNSDPIAASQPGKIFRWQLGEAAREGVSGDKTRVNFELSDWAAWGSASYAHNFPLIALDVINANQGPGGFCWGRSTDAGSCASGGQFVDLTPGTISGYNNAEVNRADAKAIALMVRDGQFMTYSRRIKLLERNAAGNLVNLVSGSPRSFNWGLIFTLANIDGNAYFYAGNGDQGDVAGGSFNYGIMADLVLMSQSFTDGCDVTTTNCSQGFNWDKGTHLMIADTDVNDNNTTGEVRDAMGIGFVSSNFLLALDDTRIAVRQHGNVTNFSDAGIDIMSPRFRFNFRGTFGGGVLPDGSGNYGPKGQEYVRAANVAFNLEGMANLRISPAPVVVNGPRNYIGFSAAFRFQDTDIAGFSESTAADASDDGTFISLSEPSNSAADLRFARISGDVTIESGMMDLRGTNEDTAGGYSAPGDGKPKLVISSTMKFGSSAASRMANGFEGVSLVSPGQPFEIGRVEFGDKPLGRIVIPSGQLMTSITLKPQN